MKRVLSRLSVITAVLICVSVLQWGSALIGGFFWLYVSGDSPRGYELPVAVGLSGIAGLIVSLLFLYRARKRPTTCFILSMFALSCLVICSWYVLRLREVIRVVKGTGAEATAKTIVSEVYGTDRTKRFTFVRASSEDWPVRRGPSLWDLPSPRGPTVVFRVTEGDAKICSVGVARYWFNWWYPASFERIAPVSNLGRSDDSKLQRNN